MALPQARQFDSPAGKASSGGSAGFAWPHGELQLRCRGGRQRALASVDASKTATWPGTAQRARVLQLQLFKLKARAPPKNWFREELLSEAMRYAPRATTSDHFRCTPDSCRLEHRQARQPWANS